MNDKMREEFMAEFVEQYGFGRMAASSNADAAGMLSCAEWAWFKSRESIPSAYTAIDMTTAAADGFRDGAASVVVEFPSYFTISPGVALDALGVHEILSQIRAAIIAAGGSVKE